jgi:VanZ family protein
MSEPPSVLPLFPYSDKLSHLLEYAILGFLLLRALVSSNKSKADFRLRTLAVALAFLYGCSDELHQYFVPERTVELLDLLTDGVGAYIGQLFFKLRG